MERKLRIDDLECNGLKIKQFADGYRFSSDAVLLANTVRCSSKDTIVDFGCGNGVISLLLTAKTPCKRVIGIELQEDVAQLASDNVAFNDLQDKITESVQVVVCNPPYFAPSSGEKREDPQVALSRHESTCDLENLLRCASEILKFGGELYIIHKTQRMAEVIHKAYNAKLTPKQLTLVYPKLSKPADTFILKCKKCSPDGLIVDRLVVYKENGEMTDEAKKLYNKTL